MIPVHWSVEDLRTGEPMASGYATIQEDAAAEMMRYARQYAQDGRVRYSMNQGIELLVRGTLGGGNPSPARRAEEGGS